MNLAIIENKIHEIRGQKVILDFHLAELYEVETKRLKEAVRRNMERFPPDFMFEISKNEFDSLRTQNVTLQTGRGKHPKYMPYAFTEHGVTMLASVLRSEKAVKMNIAIVRAFIAMRRLAAPHVELAAQLEQLRKEVNQRLGEHDVQLNAIYDTIENLLDQKAAITGWKERERIGFKTKNHLP